MLVISKLFKSDRHNVTREQMYMAVTFFNGDRWIDNGTVYSATLEDTETGRTTEFRYNSLYDLMRKLATIRPYGFCDYDVQDGGHFYALIAISSDSLKFLDYVESVERISQKDCSIDLLSFSPWKFGAVQEVLDEHNTLLNVYVYNGDATAAHLDSYDAYLTLFDAVCIYRQSVQADGFYLPTSLTENYPIGTRVAYRVKCNDLTKAQSLVAKCRVMKTGGVKTFSIG